VPIRHLHSKLVLDCLPRRERLHIGLAIGQLVGPGAGLCDVQPTVCTLEHGIALRRRFSEELRAGPALVAENRSGGSEVGQRRGIKHAALLELE